MTSAQHRRVAKIETGMQAADLSNIPPDIDTTKLTARQKFRLAACCAVIARVSRLPELSTRDLTDYLAIRMIAEGGEKAEIGNAVFNRERDFTKEDLLPMATAGRGHKQ